MNNKLSYITGLIAVISVPISMCVSYMASAGIISEFHQVLYITLSMIAVSTTIVFNAIPMAISIQRGTDIGEASGKEGIQFCIFIVAVVVLYINALVVSKKAGHNNKLKEAQSSFVNIK